MRLSSVRTQCLEGEEWRITATPMRAVSASAIPMTTLEARPAKPKAKEIGVTTNS
jgi:hypothetical protein